MKVVFLSLVLLFVVSFGYTRELTYWGKISVIIDDTPYSYEHIEDTMNKTFYALGNTSSVYNELFGQIKWMRFVLRSGLKKIHVVYDKEHKNPAWNYTDEPTTMYINATFGVDYPRSWGASIVHECVHFYMYKQCFSMLE